LFLRPFLEHLLLWFCYLQLCLSQEVRVMDLLHTSSQLQKGKYVSFNFSVMVVQFLPLKFICVLLEDIGPLFNSMHISNSQCILKLHLWMNLCFKLNIANSVHRLLLFEIRIRQIILHSELCFYVWDISPLSKCISETVTRYWCCISVVSLEWIYVLALKWYILTVSISEQS